MQAWSDRYLKGESYKTIADSVGVSYQTVRRCVQYNGTKPRRNYEKGLQALRAFDLSLRSDNKELSERSEHANRNT